MPLGPIETFSRFALQRRMTAHFSPVHVTTDEMPLQRYFDRIYVINLDRRPDRWKQVSQRLARARLKASRFSASDARETSLLSAYQAYLEDTASVAPSANILSESDVYRSGDHVLRVRSLQQHWKTSPIKTVGAYAYLHSWKRILQEAVRDNLRSILVFDDDVVLHKQIHPIFRRALPQLPNDWAVLQLGTLRRRGLKRTRWWSSNLFMNEGMSIGSHAVGLSQRVFSELLELTSRLDAVFDDGALSTLTWRYRSRSYILFPEVAIQELADSDIQQPIGNMDNEQQKAARRNHWILSDYDF